MKILVLLFGLIAALPALAGDTEYVPGGQGTAAAVVGGHDSCRAGTVRGGGYDSTTDYYDWACGNYNWSAEKGGALDFNTANVTGGVAFTVTCTSTIDPAGTGRYLPDNACRYAGEVLTINAGPDIWLALEMTRPGGTVYLPSGIYVDRICGFSAYDQDGLPNSGATRYPCPTSRLNNGHVIKITQTIAGRQLIGEGSDPDGDRARGSSDIGFRDGTYIVYDGNSRDPADAFRYDDATCTGGAGTTPCSTDAFCAGIAEGTCTGGIQAVQWAHYNGGGQAQTKTPCIVVDDTGGEYHCDQATTKAPFWHESAAYTAVTSELMGNFFLSDNTVCFRDVPSVTDLGTCTDDPAVKCDETADCVVGSVDLGVCRGNVTAMADDLMANGRDGLIKITSNYTCADGEEVCSAAGAGYVAYATVESVGGACGSGSAGLSLDLGLAGDGDFPFDWDRFSGALGVPDSDGVMHVMDPGLFQGGRWSDIHVSPNNWYDDSVANSNCNGCPATVAGGVQMDDPELMNIGTALMPRMDRITMEHGSAFSNSNFDGSAVIEGLYRETVVRDQRSNNISDMNQGHGWENFYIEDANCEVQFGSVTSCFNVFAGPAKISNGKMVNINADQVISIAKPAQDRFIWENLDFENVTTGFGVFRISSALGGLIQNIRIKNLDGRFLYLEPQEDQRIEGLTIQHVTVTGNTDTTDFSNSGLGHNFVTIDDAADSEGNSVVRGLDFNHWTVSTQERNGCYFLLGGNECASGSCPSPANIELYRKDWSFSDMVFDTLPHGPTMPATLLSVDAGLDEVTTTTAHFFHTGDGYLTSNSALYGISAAPTQYWVNVVDSDTFSLHTSQSDALADASRLDITADAGAPIFALRSMVQTFCVGDPAAGSDRTDWAHVWSSRFLPMIRNITNEGRPEFENHYHTMSVREAPNGTAPPEGIPGPAGIYRFHDDNAAAPCVDTVAGLLDTVATPQDDVTVCKFDGTNWSPL